MFEPREQKDKEEIAAEKVQKEIESFEKTLTKQQLNGKTSTFKPTMNNELSETL